MKMGIIENEKACCEFFEKFNFKDNKIGGYAYFRDYDVREFFHEEYEILLLQIKREERAHDWGTTNFFIKKENFKNLDFRNVLYNWDY
jgi:uncharacterized protein YwqG